MRIIHLNDNVSYWEMMIYYMFLVWEIQCIMINLILGVSIPWQPMMFANSSLPWNWENEERIPLSRCYDETADTADNTIPFERAVKSRYNVCNNTICKYTINTINKLLCISTRQCFVDKWQIKRYPKNMTQQLQQPQKLRVEIYIIYSKKKI